MKKLETLSVLPCAWITLGALSLAQNPAAFDGNPPPRMPIPPAAQVAPDTAPAPVIGRRVRSLGQGAQVENTEVRQDAIRHVSADDQRFSRLHWDTDGQGTTWVRGRRFKASFGADGATYYPLFGSNQPKHYPLQLSLASATSNGQSIPLAPVVSAERDGDRVVIHRGPIDEVYELSVDGLEQTFVVAERPLQDLQLFVSLASEMVFAEREDGFEFTNELGAVRYGQAFAREAGGHRRALETSAVGGGVRIDVGADYLATAQFPLVVDPVVFTQPIDTTTFDDYHSQAAFDASTGHYLYVYQEQVTLSDHDVYSEMLTSAGAIFSAGYVDNSVADWYYPSVANLNAYDQFLVVGRVVNSVLGDVLGRETGAATVSYGPIITIASGALPTDRGVSVGGDPYAATPAYYCVVFERQVSTSNTNIQARLVTNTGTLVGTTEIAVDTSSGTLDRFPSISKGNGGTNWNVAWQRGTGTSGSIRAAQISWTGNITTPSTGVVSTVLGEILESPSVSSPLSDGRYLVVCTADFGGGDHDIYAMLRSGATSVAVTNLNEYTPFLYNDQQRPRVDSDGENFALLYSERVGTGSFDVFVSMYHPWTTSLGLFEERLPVAATGVGELADSIVAETSTGGTGHRYGLGWSFTGSGGSDIGMGFYEDLVGGPITSFCPGDGTGSICPCANGGGAGHGCASSVNASGALLVGTGHASISADDLVLTASGMPTTASCLFFQGNGTPLSGMGTNFGDGLRCVNGTVIRLGPKTASGGTASYPTGSDLHVSVKGAVLATGLYYYQCWYRNSGAFCTPSTFNLTNGVKVIWMQ